MISSLRILHVMLGKGLGGIETMFAHYANALRERSHHVTNLISERAHAASALTPHSNVVFIPARSQYDPRLIIAAHRVITTHEPDIILTHGKRADRVLTYAQALFGRTIPHVELLHRTRLHHLHRADLTIVVNQDIAAQFRARHGANASVMVLPNFVMQMPQAAPRPAINQALRIGFLGRFVPEKGLDMLLEAASNLHRQGMRFTLHIGGDGPLKTTLMQQARMLEIDAITTWYGWVNNPSTFYQQIDCLCVPSRHESFGLIIIEAFAHAVPVLATRTSGPTTIIHHEQDGWLCEVSAAAITEQLAAIIGNPVSCERASQKALARAPEYHASNIVPKMEAALHQTVQRFKKATRA